MNDTILKLLSSTNTEDCLIAVSLIAELPNPRAFFKEHGKVLKGQRSNIGYESFGYRWECSTKATSKEYIYYKIKDDYYILVTTDNRIVECYKAYAPGTKVVNH